MKDAYTRYGPCTRQLELSLTQRERELLTRFLTYCAASCSPQRLRRYRICLLQFRDVVEKPLDQVTRDDAVAFWGLLNSAPYEEHTKITTKRIIKRFLRWYYRDLDMLEPLKITACYLVNKSRINKSTLLKPEEIKHMLHAAERIRDKALLVLLYETGARPQEVRELKWQDISWEEQEVHLYSRKTQDDRDLPIQEALKHLKRWHDEWVYPDPQLSDYIFPSIVGSRPDRTEPISVTYINRIMQRLARRAGVSRRISTYLLRHTRLTELQRMGVTGVEFRKFAGHKTSRQEAVYVHLDNEDMKRSVLEKVYRISETESQVKRYEERIQVMEQQLTEVLAFLKKAQGQMLQVRDAVRQQQAPASKSGED